MLNRRQGKELDDFLGSRSTSSHISTQIIKSCPVLMFIVGWKFVSRLVFVFICGDGI